MKNLLIAILLLSLASCSSRSNTLHDSENGAKTIYVLGEDDALKITRLSILSVLPSYQVTNIDWPYKGHLVTFRSAISTYTQRVIAIPVTGKTSSGKEVTGYYFEVSGEGSSFIQGKMKNSAIFDQLQQLLKDTGKGVVVTNYLPAS